MNNILRKITTELFDNLENDNKQFYKLEKNNYGVYYNPEKEIINHFYYDHKIFSINFKEKRIKFIKYNSRLIKMQLNYLFKFYEKFDFLREELKL